MKKIAIVTTHRCDNFGAALQAYSLVMACRELGAGAVLLDWRLPYFEKLYHRAYRYYRNPLVSLKRFLAYWGFARPMRKAYAAFRKMMPVSRKICSLDELKKAGNEFDAFIVGSDQVWNPRNSTRGDPHTFDRANLLTFTDRPKYAYAASIGTPEIQPSDLQLEFVAEWKKFNLITMREYEGAECVAKALGRPIETVLDPVLLHDANWWRKLFPATSLRRGKYVFVYDIGFDLLLRNYARQLARELGAEVVSVLVSHAMWVHDETAVSVGPREFIELLANADAVVTNSFHASAFCVVFGKQLNLYRQDHAGNPNTRFSSLCKITGIAGMNIVNKGCESVVRFECATADQTQLEVERQLSFARLERMVK